VNTLFSSAKLTGCNKSLLVASNGACKIQVVRVYRKHQSIPPHAITMHRLGC
jgi:hypothetical protein